MKKKRKSWNVKTIYFKRNGFACRECLTCGITVVDGMYVAHAKRKHHTRKVEFKDW